MSKLQTLFALSMTTIGLAIGANTANAFSVVGNVDGEQAFMDLEATIDVAAEGRIGDLGRAGEHEFNIHIDNGSGQTVVDQYRAFDWVSDEAVEFSLDYSSTDSLLTYIIGGQTLSYETNADFEDLFIRTTARDVGNSAVVDNLVLNGTTIDATSSYSCNGGCDFFNSSQYLILTDILDENGDFSLTGNATLSWVGDRPPTRSKLAFQAKLGNVDWETESEKVPEPASLVALGIAGMLVSRLRRR